MAAGHGARVALAESLRIGGTCVIRGCVPKKLMVLASRCSQEIDVATAFGWTVGERRFDWESSEKRRVGKESVCTGRSWWPRHHTTINNDDRIMMSPGTRNQQ